MLVDMKKLRNRKILSVRSRFELAPRPVKWFREALEWDPHEWAWRSRATGDSRTHEALFRTSDGRWYIHWWARVPGWPHRWFEIEPAEARAWLERCGYTEAVRKFFEEREGGK